MLEDNRDQHYRFLGAGSYWVVGDGCYMARWETAMAAETYCCCAYFLLGRVIVALLHCICWESPRVDSPHKAGRGGWFAEVED